MIPSDIKLFSWIDVEEVLARIPSDEWPKWLISASAYWDGLTLTVTPQVPINISDWLSSLFAPRFLPSQAGDDTIGKILLESRTGNERVFSVSQEITYDNYSTPKLIPTLRRPSIITSPATHILAHKPVTQSLPPVVAFHSFKGGVGRTIQAIAFCQALVKAKQQVLLVDGDLEAPGISWLLQSRLPDAPIALSDFLALAHGDTSPNRDEAVQLTGDRLKDAQIDGIYVLPAFRSMERYASLEIRPEHLLQGSEDPYILTTLLARLGKSLNVDVVVVDLRAGLSELAAGLLLNSKVYRVLVTTLGDQSVAGTKQVLQLISDRALPKEAEDPLPAIIFTQVTKDSLSSDLFSRQQERLAEAASPFFDATEQDATEQLLGLTTITSEFDNNLLALPSKWEEAFGRIERAGVPTAIHPLVSWIPNSTTDVQVLAPVSEAVIKQQREDLTTMASKLVYAERGEGTEFLATAPLRKLTSDHRHSVPISVIVGAKGAGKTYTFLQVMRCKSWDEFAREAQASEPQVNALICPVLESSNLEQSTKLLVQQVKEDVAHSLELANPLSAIEFRNVIRDHIKENPHEGQWRKYWLDAIAWSIGLHPNKENAGGELAVYLTESKRKLVVVIDGLEDLFQNFSSSESEQAALRALVQEVPEWLNQQPGRPLGILIFIRRDMVLAAVKQNAAQLMDRYSPYALKWNRVEALRLVAWISQKAGVLQTEKTLHEMEEQSLIQALYPLWAKKLGGNDSREGRSADWVIAALSDLNGQIQARDLVRLLSLAAKNSISSDKRWNDRVLTPTAIKTAILECSSRKIDEITTENKPLGELFTRLKGLKTEARNIPFVPSDANLTREEIKTLEDNGVLTREKDQYYMPEIFRLGLLFTLKSGARPRVLLLASRAAQVS